MLSDSTVEFPAVSWAEWQALAEKGGKPVGKLARTDEGGLTIEPLYVESTPLSAARRGRGRRDWLQVATYPDANALATAGLRDVARGVTGVEVRGGAELNAALDKHDLAALDTVVRGGPDAARALLAAWAGQGVAGRGNLGLDPSLGRVRGRELADLVAEAPDRALLIGDVRYHQAGATEPQGLGAALASGVEALRTLTADGLTVDHANAKLEFDLALDPAFFLGIAKLRAFRACWARVLEACGATGRDVMVRARPSLRAFTQADPWVNLLRNTATVFAGAVGGAEAVVSLPLDAAIGDADRFSRRVARNTQTVLAQESSLGQVADPAGGSHFIESLTAQMARAAWSEFQAIERSGGMAQVLADGSFANAVAASATARARNVAKRRRPITGVSEFPNPDESPVERTGREAQVDRAFPLRRDSAPFEALRQMTQAQPQTVFLANLGTVAEHTARATFARNFFGAAGLGVRSSNGVEDPAKGTRVACICGTDEAYEEQAESVARRLRVAGIQTVLLAGRTEVPGVDHNIYLGCDVLEVLQAVLGVER